MGYLRLLLALGVLGQHAGVVADATSRTMVSCFFLLSGFLMALTLDRNYTGSPLPFYWNRILRVYPLHIASSLLILLLWPTFAWSRLSSGESLHYYSSLARTLLLTFDHASTLNGPAWTLPFELLFYLLAPLVARFGGWGFLAYAISGYLLSDAQLPLGPFHGPLEGSLSSSIYTSAFLFGAGGSAYYVSKRPHVSRIASPLTTYLPFVATATLIISTSRFASPAWLDFSQNWGGILGALTACAVLAFLVTWPRKESSLSRLCGDLCYPVYLLHWPIFQVWFDGKSWPSRSFNSYSGVLPYGDYWVKLLLGTCFTFFAAFMWLRLEKRLLHHLRAGWTSRSVMPSAQPPPCAHADCRP